MADNITVYPYGSPAAVTTVPGGTVGADKLWLPMFQGEILKAYDQYNFMERVTTHEMISGGTTREFPVTGTVALQAEWGAGEELVGGGTTSDTIRVRLDNRPIAAHFEVDNISKLVSQWDFMSVLAHQVGQRLANTRDKQLLVYVLRASAETVLASNPQGLGAAPIFSADAHADFGQVQNTSAGATARTDAALLFMKALEDWVVYLQENDLPTDTLYAGVTPKQFQDLRALGVPRVEADLSAVRPVFGGSVEYGGAGLPITDGLNKLDDRLMYMGVTILKTNHLPVVDYPAAGANAIGEARYDAQGDFGSAQGGAAADDGVCALMWHPAAIGGLSLQGMKVDTTEDVRRNTVFTVASMMSGTGVLRPELAACFCSDVTAGAVTRGPAATAATLYDAIGLTEEFVTTGT